MSPGPLRAGPVLRDPDFLRVFAVGTLSNTMRWMEILVIGVYTYQATGSAFLVASMLFARMCPYLVFGAVLGAAIERLDRRKVLLGALLVMTVSSAVLAALAVGGQIRLWHIALGAFLNGVFWAAEYPTRRTLLGEIAGLERLGSAMGFDSTSTHATRMVGPALGGLLFEHYSLAGPYLLGVLLYGAAAVSLLTLAYRPRSESTTETGVLSILLEGLRYIRGNRVLAGALVTTVLVNFFGFSYGTLLPVIGEDKFALSAFPIGVLASMEGVGAMLGGVAIALSARPGWFVRLYVGGSFLFLTMIVVFSFSPGFYPSLPVLLLGGIGIAGFASMQSALVFSATEAAMRRRVMGVLVVCIGAGPLGVLHTGLLAELLGADVAVRVIGLEGLAALLVALWIWPELRRRGLAAPGRGG